MSYKSLLVHLDPSESTRQRLEIALRLARQFGAHLTGLYATFSPDARAFYVMAGTADYYSAHERRYEQRRGALERLFHAEAIRAKVDVQFVCADGHANQVVAQRARFADLVIAGQTNPNDPESFIDDDFAEHLVMSAGRPVLFVPYAGVFPTVGSRILMAWDGSREATRAAHDAMPFLAHAKKTTVVAVHGAAGEPPGERVPGADIALTLARHGAAVDVLEIDSPADSAVADVLLSRAAEAGCDTLVMGAYGHSRWRELAMGGVTRTVLKSMTVPVLMSR